MHERRNNVPLFLEEAMAACDITNSCYLIVQRHSGSPLQMQPNVQGTFLYVCSRLLTTTPIVN